MCEKFVFNDLYGYLEEKELLSDQQSGFCSHDLYVGQLLSIVNEFYSLLDAYPTF